MNEDIGVLIDANGGYWGSHSRFPIDDWRYLVANGETRRGYWEWVKIQLEHG